MKRIPRYIYNLLRFALVTPLVAMVLAFIALYAALTVPSLQDKVKHVGEQELSKLLHTGVSIEHVSIMPFNEVMLQGVRVPEPQGDSLFYIDRLGAGISLKELIFNRKLVFTYAEVIGLKGRITQPDKNSPTNMQFLIDAFKPKGDEPPKPYDLQFQHVMLRDIEVSYDRLDAAHKPAGQFDAMHLHVMNVCADLTLPRIKNNDFVINLQNLSLTEKSGFVLKRLSTNLAIDDNALSASNIVIELPNSRLNPADITLHYSSLKTMGEDIKNSTLALTVKESYLKLSDIAAFVPKLRDFNDVVHFSTIVTGNRKKIDLRMLSLRTSDNKLIINTNGAVDNLININNLQYVVPTLKLYASADIIDRVLSHFVQLKPQVAGIVSRCGDVKIDGAISGTLHNVNFKGDLGTSLGAINLDGVFASAGNSQNVEGHVITKQFNVGKLIDNTQLIGEVALDVKLAAQLADGKLASSDVDGLISYIDLKGYRYHNISANFTNTMQDFNGNIAINDPAGKLDLTGSAHLDGPASKFDLLLNTDGINLSRFGLSKDIPDGDISVNVAANFTGNSLDNITGNLAINNIEFKSAQGKHLALDHIVLNADNLSSAQHISFDSDFLNGTVTGSYNFATLVPTVKGMLSAAFPQFFGSYSQVLQHAGKKNDLQFDAVLEPTDELNALLKSPVKFIYKTSIKGNINESSNSFDININAPYLVNGNKLIEGTDISARLDSATGRVTAIAQTLIPLKKGKAAIMVNANGINNRLDTDVAWKVKRDEDFHGNLNFSTLLGRNPEGKMMFDIDVNPTELVFNGKPWQVEPAKVFINNGVIKVGNMSGHSDEQYIKINGEVSKDPSSELCLELNDISLDYIFETLNINHVNFGGQATGKFYASDLLTKAPRIFTPQLHVDALSYNNTNMGDADIKSRWLNDQKAVELNADLAQQNGKHSVITGGIFVADDSLHLTFDADHANVGFLKPYMAAFTSDVQGEVSGKAILFGNFKTINLKGDVMADSLRFKLDYTNVYYTCAGDSVHMEPDLIEFSDVRIHDREGHEGKFNGILKHDSFHNPEFNFEITDAKNLLCYDTNAEINPRWYGTIYGNGAAFVTGKPGIVEIKVGMTSAPNSRFTFVLSDAQQASEYNFITFRDRNKPEVEIDTVVVVDTIPDIVKQYTAKAKVEEEGIPTRYTIDLQGDINPDAQLVIVMDPVGGDRIKCTGRGNMHLTYNNNDEMTMHGKYTLEKGDYNFTLQDIIIKDFTIRNGSSITFQGDPYAAILDLEAVYSLNANIRDLDETFASDKDINRTNVPVHALLRAKGAMSQPEISFDLEFPTLTTDVYRRIMSIISTDDMMNRQIIYLLALNRFYTPDYMNTTRTNNEFTSVASSTISSQLTSMLGKMSENWSISPNFRTDRGDFSDVEVDLALSSQLLNNRLLFNGNFGYRDNTYNTRNSNFIGDFDIEYLLNKKGTVRLKAYNHFNDQNYYVRNALTTQGVGIVWKHDFDRPFDFLKRKSIVPKFGNDSIKNDSIKIQQ